MMAHSQQFKMNIPGCLTLSLILKRFPRLSWSSSLRREMGEEVVGKALVLNHHGSYSVRISHMASRRCKGIFGCYPLSYFRVYYIRTGDILESLIRCFE